MFEWNTNNIIDATGGRGKSGCHNLNISTDTRNIKKGDLFIALKGKNFDGHDFLHEAFLKGAAAAVVSEDKYRNLPVIVVQDTLKALHDMASYYIRNVLVNAEVIAITGSVGKTTTKDMLHTVLSQYGVSHVNDGNLNNNIGLPLTILKAPENCRYLILEMGMNKAGEIKELSKISNPNIAVITNIEPVHVENFSSLFDIAQAKLEILYGVKNNGTLILNKDNKYYDYLLSHVDRDVVSFGRSESATVCLLNVIKNDKGLNLKIRLNNNQIMNCNLCVQGKHFVYSVLAVVAVIQNLGLNLSKLPLALENFNITKGRGSVHKAKYNGKCIHLIDDSYNASPASMKAAIRTLGIYSNRRKVALLGDMLELGNKSITFHMKLLDSIVKYDVDKVYTVGKFMLKLHRLLPGNIKGTHFNDSNQLKSNLANIVQNNDVVLVKGSRGVKMDFIVQGFIIEY
ncbi:UDP-N-acetylmuramoyl-tripeptide--D-alanyl-D-alanine ligase [Wolbachia endosymbiont of Brugia malayi]|uniref:UDP-N-acetylmuramoyl-tripeptide--D-alanyl-D- alanine ligase n=1 Tax=Wolbachia endosymbiont of Brugia malayi TaxID=80849 RepID=UPI00004C92FC|nr:UDP-N-acetylmuramoyl-tripeptide--D-alanyl-D-alanine ligase [Wolbachia endosymbiont of Brugia malayi]AAW70827.1 UDP-N-acetylmuramyl pentapeptide synthase [Wolbachia endosymbiont strain TRS of Brugia malayi]QCB61793.1 UDP-N-acetylmuramoyl-tripeptide--D-alanyl-D-alanine ligase [Wolbachia endosymbiont of Brugia malayi]